MARKRMFSNDIIDTDQYLMLSNEAKVLYFYFGMKADDDGFISNTTMFTRMLQIDKKYVEELVENDFLINFNNGVYVVADWLENNYLDVNKVKPTLNQEEYNFLDIVDKRYVLKGNQGLNQSLTKVDTKFTQSRVEENRIEENRLEENRENNAPKVAVFSSDSKEYYLSEYLYNKILENDNKFKKPNLQAWAKDMDKLIRLDSRDFIEIKNVIDYATNNEFWKPNILSAKKLREKFSTLLLQLKNTPGNKERIRKEKQYKAINDFINSDNNQFEGEF